MISPTIPTQDYLEYARRLRQLHALIRVGQCDSDEAETVRDSMDDYYLRLSVDEIERLNLLSADLNSISDGPVADLPSTTVEEIERKHLAVSREDDPRKLRSLLGSEPNDPNWNPFLRFLYWSKLGDVESARPFAQFILANLEVEIIEVERMLSTESNDIRDALETPDGSSSQTLTQQAQHVGRTEVFRALKDKIQFLMSRIGRLDEDESIESEVAVTPAEPGWDAEAIQDSLILLMATFSSVRWAA